MSFSKTCSPITKSLGCFFPLARPNDEGTFLSTENVGDLRKIEYREIEAVADTEQEGESEEEVIANRSTENANLYRTIIE